MKKLLIYIQLHWVKIVLVIVFLGMFTAMALFLKTGLKDFTSLESFSRKQLSAQMGYFLVIGIFTAFFQVPLFFGMQYFIMQGGLAKLGAEQMDKAKVNVKWDEVIGMENAKREAGELIKLLKDRSLLKIIGGKIIKGTLMIGPPGCGKTYLAKAIATECGLPMLSAVGSEFVGIFVGQGTAQMKSLFKQARALAKMEGGCLIFIDEIDSFARPRQADRGFGGGVNDHNATVNQFLTELDGLRQAENNIVVIAATNVPENELDPAIMRAGRFDRKIHITLPNLDERLALFKFYLGRIKTDASINADIMARKALYCSPSDIDNMVREAGLIALREHRDTVFMKDLSEAYDRVTFGLKANITLTENEKIWTAYHEAGHAVIAYLTHPTNDVIKATIIPHKGSLGFIYQRPTEELHSANRDHLVANIKVSLASYAAEKIKFGSTSSGVGGGPGSDFNTAMGIAHAMVWQYGMGKSGLIGDFHALTRNGTPLISEKTKEILDADVQDILQTYMKEVHSILTARKDLLEQFAQELLKKGELEYDEIENIFKKFGLESASRKSISAS